MRPNPSLCRQVQPPELSQPKLGDLRFRALLTAEAWHLLPPAVQARFSKRLQGGATAVYSGVIDDMAISRAGRLLAQLLRIIGAPLPLRHEIDVPSVVTVTEDVATGGQIWTRLYARRCGFPQIIQSSKRFSGPTGLEEYIGFGISMQLKAEATDTALTFKSAGYSLRLGALRVPLPQFLSPGQCTVSHAELTPDTFRFSLQLEHPWFGLLVWQSGVFSERERP